MKIKDFFIITLLIFLFLVFPVFSEVKLIVSRLDKAESPRFKAPEHRLYSSRLIEKNSTDTIVQTGVATCFSLVFDYPLINPNTGLPSIFTVEILNSAIPEGTGSVDNPYGIIRLVKNSEGGTIRYLKPIYMDADNDGIFAFENRETGLPDNQIDFIYNLPDTPLSKEVTFSLREISGITIENFPVTWKFIADPAVQTGVVCSLHGRMDVSVDSTIRLEFQEPMDRGYVESSILFTYALDGQSQILPVNYQWENQDTTLVIIPDGILPLNKTLILSLSGLKDKAGNFKNSLLNSSIFPQRFEFGTNKSYDAPVITYISPLDHPLYKELDVDFSFVDPIIPVPVFPPKTSNVELKPQFQILFSEQMKEGSLYNGINIQKISNNDQIDLLGDIINCNIIVNPDLKGIQITPQEELIPDTLYALVFDSFNTPLSENGEEINFSIKIPEDLQNKIPLYQTYLNKGGKSRDFFYFPFLTKKEQTVFSVINYIPEENSIIQGKTDFEFIFSTKPQQVSLLNGFKITSSEYGDITDKFSPILIENKLTLKNMLDFNLSDGDFLNIEIFGNVVKDIYDNYLDGNSNSISEFENDNFFATYKVLHLKLNYVIPGDGSTLIKDGKILMIFNKPVDRFRSGKFISLRRKIDNNPVALFYNWSENSTKVEIVSGVPLNQGEDYVLTITGKDTGNENSVSAITGEFLEKTSVFNYKIRETSSPVVTGSYPIDGDSEFEGERIEIYFNRDIDVKTLNNFNALFFQNEKGESVFFDYSYKEFGIATENMPEILKGKCSTLIISPSDPMIGGVNYFFTLTTVITDSEGVNLYSPYVLNFRTKDTVPPTLVDVLPVSGEIERRYSLFQTVVLKFSKGMNENSVKQNFFLRKQNTDIIVNFGTWSNDEQVFSFTPVNALDPGSVYEIFVKPERIFSYSGLMLGNEEIKKVGQFTTRSNAGIEISVTFSDRGYIQYRELSNFNGVSLKPNLRIEGSDLLDLDPVELVNQIKILDSIEGKFIDANFNVDQSMISSSFLLQPELKKGRLYYLLIENLFSVDGMQINNPIQIEFYSVDDEKNLAIKGFKDPLVEKRVHIHARITGGVSFPIQCIIKQGEIMVPVLLNKSSGNFYKGIVEWDYFRYPDSIIQIKTDDRYYQFPLLK